MIEELDDIIEEIADNIGVYGSHVEASADCECRACFTSSLSSRILRAVEIRNALPPNQAWRVERDELLAERGVPSTAKKVSSLDNPKDSQKTCIEQIGSEDYLYEGGGGLGHQGFSGYRHGLRPVYCKEPQFANGRCVKHQKAVETLGRMENV